MFNPSLVKSFRTLAGVVTAGTIFYSANNVTKNRLFRLQVSVCEPKAPQVKDAPKQHVTNMEMGDGCVFDGEIAGGRLNGQGRLVLKDGTVFEGFFVDDMLSGKACWSLPDGTVMRGTFVNGNPHGLVTITYPQGTIDEYQYANGVRGKLLRKTYPDGSIMEGTFVNNELCGWGKVATPEGHIIEGNFLNGKPHGQVDVTFDGGVTHGNFVHGRQHGYQKFVLPTGQVQEGMVRCDVLYGEWQITEKNGEKRVMHHKLDWMGELKLVADELRFIDWPELKLKWEKLKA